MQVAYGHAAEVPYWEGPLRPAIFSILLTFFALSGFLVAGSLERTKTTSEFLTLRAIRLVPALAVEVLLSAILIGPLTTTLPLIDYFGNLRFFTYFGNIIGRIQFDLPGVFTGNPMPRVNTSLWTVPFELECYLSIAIASIIGLSKNRHIFITVTTVAWLAFCVHELVTGGPSRFFFPNGRLLVFAFLFGIAAYKYRDVIPHSGSLFAVSIAAYWISASFPATSWLATVPAVYITAFIGSLNPPKVTVLRDGDYSYGVYVFAYPLQQLVAFEAPPLREWWLIATIAIPCSLLYAAFSWHCIEKPILGRRKQIVSAVASAINASSDRVLGLQRREVGLMNTE